MKPNAFQRWLVPVLSRRELAEVGLAALCGAVVAGLYGVLHDQVTYTLWPEYFTRFKFQQFAYADLGLGPRVFVGCIGFLATWWVGLIVGWILGRRCVPGRSREQAWRLIRRGFVTVFLCGLWGGLIGAAYGQWRQSTGDFSGWETTLIHYRVTDPWPFLRVGFIHNAGYLGGLLGLIVTYFIICPAVPSQPTAAPHLSTTDAPR